MARPFGARHPREAHAGDLGGRLNWLRAGVLGANDGIVSTAGIVVGVAGATSSLTAILTAGVAGLVAGSLSMAGGEYVSVSTQRDTEQAAVRLEQWELANLPEQEMSELTGIYQERGLSEPLARQVAQELMAKDALHAHAEAELHIDPDVLTSPWQAAGASFISFAIGGLLPLVAILFPLAGWRVAVCVAAVVVGLVVTGFLSARLGNAGPRAAVVRNVAVGLLTMAVTWAVGRLFGVATG
ncbi:MAG TPA: VIT family protein [Thermomicrobiales bacterium]|nr:VIT family protein [Thermomicrobiales bacterium]